MGFGLPVADLANRLFASTGWLCLDDDPRHDKAACANGPSHAGHQPLSRFAKSCAGIGVVLAGQRACFR